MTATALPVVPEGVQVPHSIMSPLGSSFDPLADKVAAGLANAVVATVVLLVLTAWVVAVEEPKTAVVNVLFVSVWVAANVTTVSVAAGNVKV